MLVKELLKTAIRDAKNKGLELSKNKLCALMSLDYGVSESKLREYLDLLEHF